MIDFFIHTLAAIIGAILTLVFYYRHGLPVIGNDSLNIENEFNKLKKNLVFALIFIFAGLALIAMDAEEVLSQFVEFKGVVGENAGAALLGFAAIGLFVIKKYNPTLEADN